MSDVTNSQRNSCLDLYIMLSQTMHPDMVPEIFVRDLMSTKSCDRYLKSNNMVFVRDGYIKELRTNYPDIYIRLINNQKLSTGQEMYLGLHFREWKPVIRNSVNTVLWKNLSVYENLKMKFLSLI